jgi:hypothetical protein
LSPVLDILLLALGGEAETNRSRHILNEFAIGSSSEGDVAFVLTVDSSKNVLTIVGIGQTSGVISPLAKIPAVHDGVENGAWRR